MSAVIGTLVRDSDKPHCCLSGGRYDVQVRLVSLTVRDLDLSQCNVMVFTIIIRLRNLIFYTKVQFLQYEYTINNLILCKSNV